MCKSVNCEKTSILVSSVGSFFSYVNDARTHVPEAREVGFADPSVSKNYFIYSFVHSFIHSFMVCFKKRPVVRLQAYNVQWQDD